MSVKREHGTVVKAERRDDDDTPLVPSSSSSSSAAAAAPAAEPKRRRVTVRKSALCAAADVDVPKPALIPSRAHLAVDSALECPICYCVMEADVYSCASGHVICVGCIARVSDLCPTCRGSIGVDARARCLWLERIRESALIRCRVDECTEVCDGIRAWRTHTDACVLNLQSCANAPCAVRLQATPLREHARTCVHRIIPCPFGWITHSNACGTVVTRATVRRHMEEAHVGHFDYISLRTDHTITVKMLPNATETGATWGAFMVTPTHDELLFRVALIRDGSARADRDRHVFAFAQRLTDRKLMYRLTVEGQIRGGNITSSFTGAMQPATEAFGGFHNTLVIPPTQVEKYIHTSIPEGVRTMKFTLNVWTGVS